MNINQFGQQTVKGALDLQITKSGVISGQVGASQSGSLEPGQRLKIVTTAGAIPEFQSATAGEASLSFFLVYDLKNSSPVAGDFIQVTFVGGPVMYMEYGDTIAAGAAVQDKGDGTVEPLAASKLVGFALDPGVAGDIGRIILRDALVS